MNDTGSSPYDDDVRSARSLLAAAPDPATAGEAALELAGTLESRYGWRVAGGDERGAGEDLDEIISVLEEALAGPVPGPGFRRTAAQAAGMAREERWRASGVAADRDAAIRWLTGCLTGGPGGSEAAGWRAADAHAALARLLGSRFAEAGGTPADLDAAVGHARAGLRCCGAAGQEQPAADAGGPAGDPPCDPDAVTGLYALLGFLLAERFRARGRADPADGRAVAAARADRDEAIEALAAAIGRAGGAAADEDVRETAGALGELHQDRYHDPWPGAVADPGDLARAVTLLSAACEGAGEPARETMECLVLALSDAYTASDAADDRERLIDWGERLLALPGADPGSQGPCHDLVAMALLDRADDPAHAHPGDVDAAIAHFEAELAVTAEDDPDRGGLLAMLADALWRRAGGDARAHADIDRMTACAADAWRLLPREEESRAQIGLYLAAGVHDRLLRPGEPFDPGAAGLAIEALTGSVPAFAGDPDLHALAVTMLGHFLAARGQFTGSAQDLAAARPWLLQALEEVPAGEPRWAQTAQTLATAMTAVAEMGTSADDLDRAISLIRTVAPRPGPDLDPERASLTRFSLGSLLCMRASFTGSERDLDEGIADLRAAHGTLPAGHAGHLAAASNLGSALLTRFTQRGDVQDLDAAEFYLGTARESAGSRQALGGLLAGAGLVIAATTGLLCLVRGAAGDLPAARDAVSHLRDALTQAPPGHPRRARIRSDLGLALLILANLTGNRPADLQQALAELRAAADGTPAGHMMRPVTVLRVAGLLVGAAGTSGDVRLLREAARELADGLAGLDPRFGGRVRYVLTLGLAHEGLYRLTGERGELDAAIGWLERAREEMSGQLVHSQRVRGLTLLAGCYRMRGERERGRETGLAALRERGREVLLQTGTARGLAVAGLAASQAAQVAGWCLDDGDPAQAVTALELGRGLILHAATAAISVPEMLAAAGHPVLAGQWRAATADQEPSPWDSGLDPAGYGESLVGGEVALHVPDDLRGRALAALAGREADRLLTPPAWRDIATALAETGADALVYLVPPAGTGAGAAVIVPSVTVPGCAPEVLPLPLLRGRDAALDAYAEAYAAPAEVDSRDTAPAEGEPAGDRWRQALEDVCDWAYPAVMAPVLRRAQRWGLPHTPRLVLVPTGRLGLVPWHAARSGAAAAGPGRYACEDAVISYAASGRQLLEVSGRTALPAQASPVIVGNPALDLPFSELEAQAIRDRCYPGGRYFGHAGADWGGRADGNGLPAEVLGCLPATGSAGASVLHLGCHATVAGSAPGASHLLLADGQRLTVEAILRQAGARPPRAAGGLVSLAACTSDHSGQAHDEALTLATAFLAAGAVTVVGARWEIPDDATSLLMFMFHHFMTSGGRSPRDALRLAQLWMIDPARPVPPTMPPGLASDAVHPGHADVVAWAAFTHQGR